MNRIYLFVLMSIFCIDSFAQSNVIKWQKSLGGTGNEEINSIRQTIDGGYIMTGSTTSADGQVTGHHGTTSSYDYWVAKLNDTGAIEWQTALGGSADDLGKSVLQAADSGYLVAGGIESGDWDVTTCTPLEWEYWLVKLSSAGVIQWTNCYGAFTAFSYDMPAYAIQAPTHHYLVLGQSNADTGQVTGNHGGFDYWLINVDTSGTLVWEKSYGGSGSDYGKCVQATSDGGYILAGSSNSNDSQVSGNHGDVDYWVVKINDTGAILWQKSLGGSGTDLGYSIRQTFDGGYIVAGASNSNDGQVSGNHGGYDYWLVKLDATGSIQWQKSLGGSGDENAYSVEQTIDSGYIVAGISTSNDSEVTGNHGGDDYWVAKLSKNGKLEWQKSLGGSGVDDAFGIQPTKDSCFIVGGGSSSVNGDVTGNHGGFDFWVVKLSDCLLPTPAVILTGHTFSTPLSYDKYQWLLNGLPVPGATNATYTASASGSYTLYVADTNGCNATSAIPIVFTNGVNTLSINPVMTVHPNPTSDKIFISGAGLVNISIYNLLGQTVKSVPQTNEVSIKELLSGVYMIKITDEQSQLLYQGKILKQ